LVLEPVVVDSVAERQVGGSSTGLVSAVNRQPVHHSLRASGATTPTMIRKWNIVPVRAERRYPDTHGIGQWVGRPGIASRVRHRGAEQKP
jgi:hypothetical protein